MGKIITSPKIYENITFYIVGKNGKVGKNLPEMNFDVQLLGGGWRRRKKSTYARGVENGGRTERQWPENLAGGRIFAGLLRLRPTSKRGETGGVGFVFKSPSTWTNASPELGSGPAVGGGGNSGRFSLFVEFELQGPF